ncbi:hypothetical protein ACQKFL_11665 [Vreelandella titanicae]|uniref:hypothetical protein n=1 Tax=Vreelandella titanicae TaxID=664683 RepID=UPI003D04641D
MSIPASEVLTSAEIAALQRKGWTPSRYFPSTHEVLLTRNGAPYGLRLSEVRQMAAPSLWERVGHWLGRGAA